MTASRFALDPNAAVLLADLGIDGRRVLRRAELPGDLLATAPVLLTPDEYYRLWTAIETESDDPALAVTIGQAISVEMFTPPLFAALCSPNLRIAAERIATYKPLIGPLTVEVNDTRAGLTITCRWPHGRAVPETLVNIELIFWAALARIATRDEVRPLRVASPHPSDATSAYLGCKMTKSPKPTITFDSNVASEPFLTHNDEMWRFFAPELRRRLADLDDTATTAERVRAALVEILPAGRSSLAAVTDQLAVSARTLQRQLQQEGTSYQAVLAGTREDLARHYLANSTMTSAEIGYLLGYEDAGTFHRAFRTWTDTTPDRIRTQSATS